MAQYLTGTPSGSAVDVRAKGVWRNGRWTVEFERRLSTGHPDDTIFAPGRAFKMAVATFDRTGDMDRASSVIELSLEAAGASAGASSSVATPRTWSFSSHHENNCGGAVKNLNRVEQELARITPETPPFVVAALREREPTFRNSKTLHEAYFASRSAWS